jgi:SAM-dependent methyltransferase
MSVGRRRVELLDASGWVFNRMARVYGARPAYPSGLVDAVVEIVGAGSRIGDLGAGVGHLALPLAERGLNVVAVEPAIEMLDMLRSAAAARRLQLQALHATAERIPVEGATLNAVLIADALHFLDAERVGHEVRRVLVPGGALAILISQYRPTPFMQSVVRIMERSAPRRPRALAQSIEQLSAVAGITLDQRRQFEDDTPVDSETLQRILRSISYIGPAMNPQRFATFMESIQALPKPWHWSRALTLHWGRG